MAQPFEIYRGRQTMWPVTLTKGKATFPIDVGSTVKARVLDGDTERRIVGDATLDHTEDGANWDQSLVIVAFTTDQTTAATKITDDAMLEIEIDSEQPWRFPRGSVVVREVYSG